MKITYVFSSVALFVSLLGGCAAPQPYVSESRLNRGAGYRPSGNRGSQRTERRDMPRTQRRRRRRRYRTVRLDHWCSVCIHLEPLVKRQESRQSRRAGRENCTIPVQLSRPSGSARRSVRRRRGGDLDVRSHAVGQEGRRRGYARRVAVTGLQAHNRPGQHQAWNCQLLFVPRRVAALGGNEHIRNNGRQAQHVGR